MRPSDEAIEILGSDQAHAYANELDRASLMFVETGVCTMDLRLLAGWPLGQMHCPVCSSMQIAGMDHIGFGTEKDLMFEPYPDEYVNLWLAERGELEHA